MSGIERVVALVPMAGVLGFQTLVGTLGFAACGVDGVVAAMGMTSVFGFFLEDLAAVFPVLGAAVHGLAAATGQVVRPVIVR